MFFLLSVHHCFSLRSCFRRCCIDMSQHTSLHHYLPSEGCFSRMMKPFPRSHIHAERHRLELNEWAVMQASLHFSQEHDGPLGLGKLFTPMPNCNWKSSLSAGGWVTSPTHRIKACRHFHPGPWSNSSHCWEGNVTGETSFCVQAQTNILQATVGWSSCPRNPG